MQVKYQDNMLIFNELYILQKSFIPEEKEGFVQQYYLGVDVSKGYADFIILDNKKEPVEKKLLNLRQRLKYLRGLWQEKVPG